MFPSDLHFARPLRALASAVALLAVSSTPLAGATRGTPYGWGGYDPLKTPADATNLVALDASLLGPIALRADGTVLVWDSSPQPPPGLSNVVAIAAGDVFHLALKADGSTVAWGGFHVDGLAITTPPAWLTNVVAITAGYDHSVALTSDGYLIPWGANALGVLNAPVRQFRPRSISAGQQNTIVVEEDGTLTGWGASHEGILNFPAGLSGLTQVSVSPFMHALALRSDGRVFAWGNNSHGQAIVPPGTSNMVQVSAGPLWSLALRDDGTVRVWGQRNAPWTQPPPDPVRFFAIAAGENRNFGLTRAPVARDSSGGTTVSAGSELQITRAFIGSDAFSVQWTFNGQPLAGETNQVLNLGNAQATWVGDFHLVASNAFGTSTSMPFHLEVSPAPPRIQVQPESLGALRGTEATFVIRAAGTDPLTYQWHFNGQPLEGQTNASLRLPAAGPGNDGAYHVVVSNPLGTVTSGVARLSTGLPAFTSAPASFIGLLNRPVRIALNVVTPEAPTYTWWRGTNVVEGAHSPVLEIARIRPELSGEYRLVVANSFGSVTSQVAQVSLREPRQPLSEPMAAMPGNLAQAPPPAFTEVLDAEMKWDTETAFAVGIRPDRTLATWAANPVTATNFTPPPGISNVAALSIGPTHAVVLLGDGTVRAWRDESYNDYGQDHVPPGLDRVVEVEAGYQFNLALRDDGEIVSWPYPDTVPPTLHGVAAISTHEYAAGALREDGSVWYWDQFSPGSPAISDPIEGVALAAGGDFVAVLCRDGRLRILNRNGTLDELPPVDGTTQVVEIAAFAQTLLARTVDGRVWAASPARSGGWAEWAPGLTRVRRLSAGLAMAFAFTDAPFLFRPPSAVEVNLRGSALLNVGAASTSPLRYQWLREGIALPGQTTPLFAIEPVRYQDDANYSVIVSNDRVSITSPPVQLRVVGPPEIARTEPQSLLAGDDLILGPTVLGPGPIQYSWFFQNQRITGATGPALRIPNVQSNVAGEYRVEASNVYGRQPGATLRVTVLPSVPRLSPPDTNALTALEGGPLRLAIAARGTEPFRFQWHFNGDALEGETNAVLARAGTSIADAGTYQLRVANDVGTTDSVAIRLTVVPTPPVILEVQPWRLANAGSPFEWTPKFAGSAPLFRQWKRYGTNLPGFTNATLTFPSVATNDAGIYSLYLSNHLGEAITGPMQLVVRPGGGPGALVTWGQPTPPMDFGLVQDFAMGGNHAHAVLTNGTVKSWVNGAFHELLAPAGLGEVVGIAAGSSFALALRADGTVRSWGYPDGGVLNLPAGMGRVVAIAAGTQHAVALQENGVPVTWGTVAQGRTNVPTAATNLIAIAARGGYNLGLRRDGTVVSWGPNVAVAVPASVSNIIGIGALPRGGLALRADRRPIVWGTGPAPAASITNLLEIATGSAHGLGLRTNGTVIGWGSNLRGQALPPAGLSNVTAIFAGLDTSAAITRAPVFASSSALTTAYREVGKPIQLAPTVQGLGPLSFQWFFNGQALDGQIAATLHFGAQTPAPDGLYTLRVSNPWQTVTNRPIQLTTFGPVEFRWVTTPSGGPILRLRAPGLSTALLQESVDLLFWMDIGSYSLTPEGTNLEVPNPLERDATFYRVVVP